MIDVNEEITQYPCGQCDLPIAEPDPFEYVINAKPVHRECFDRYQVGRPTTPPVGLCAETHPSYGQCSMFEGHQGRHRNRGASGRLIAAWWKVAPF